MYRYMWCPPAVLQNRTEQYVDFVTCSAKRVQNSKLGDGEHRSIFGGDVKGWLAVT